MAMQEGNLQIVFVTNTESNQVVNHTCVDFEMPDLSCLTWTFLAIKLLAILAIAHE